MRRALPSRPAWLPVAHSVPPPPRGRPAPDLHALFGTRPQPTHSAHSLTSPDPYARSAGAGIERARILCPACCPACMMCPCEHTRVVCPADHPQPANDDEQTQPVGAIVGSDEQQRARSCRAGAHAVPSQPTVHPQAARSLVPTNTYARSHRASPRRASPRRTSRPPSRTRASGIKWMRTLSRASASHFRRQHRAAHPPQTSETPINPNPHPKRPAAPHWTRHASTCVLALPHT